MTESAEARRGESMKLWEVFTFYFGGLGEEKTKKKKEKKENNVRRAESNSRRARRGSTGSRAQHTESSRALLSSVARAHLSILTTRLQAKKNPNPKIYQ